MSVKSKQPLKWRDLIIAIVGGDEREQEIARLALATGAEVRVHGFPLPDQVIKGAREEATAAAAMAGADIVLFPIPGMADDGSIFATEKIIPDENLLGHMAENAHIILGKADAALRDAAARVGITLHEYEADQELMLLRAPAIIEGALQIAFEKTDITIHAAQIVVVGHGNIGAVLTRTLIALGARVTVAARSPLQRAAAYALGAETISLDQLRAQAVHFDMVMSTVPAPVVTPEIIDNLPAHALVMDLSAPPGGCDLEYARASGRPAVWARALGRRAPVTVGRSQWRGIANIIDGILEGGDV